MKLFVNDIPVNLVGKQKEINMDVYDVVIHAEEDSIDHEQLIADVVILDASLAQIGELLRLMKNRKLKKLDSVTFIVSNLEEAIKYVKKKFTIIKAAGGLVEKEGKVLLIYRLKKWDLPKGKLDKKEDTEEGAVREVEEECNIKVKSNKKICSTWHTYTRNGKGILKKTTWYAMECLDDSAMKPQVEEDIEEVRWMDPREVRQALYDSYPSIRHVFHKYYQMIKAEEDDPTD
jgi:8-oxo-(d)GTP phosphatase